MPNDFFFYVRRSCLHTLHRTLTFGELGQQNFAQRDLLLNILHPDCRDHLATYSYHCSVMHAVRLVKKAING